MLDLKALDPLDNQAFFIYINMEKFSVFAAAKVTTNPITITLKQAFNIIQKGGKDGKIKKAVEAARNEPDKGRRNKIKESLPCMCISGVFSYRNKDSIINHSGLIGLDFDGIPDDKFQDFYTRIITDKYTRMAFMSPSGKGYKAIISIPADIEKHEQYFQGLAEYYNSPYFDKVTKDIGRVCYASYDEYAYLNLESETFTTAVDLSKRSIPSESNPQIEFEKADDWDALKLVHKWTNSDILYGPGSKHQHLLKFAGNANRAGIDEVCAVQYYESNYDKKDVEKIVRNIYKNYSGENGSYPIRAKRGESIQVERGEQKQQSYLTFWAVKEDSKKGDSLIFSRHKFIEWLSLSGWGRYHYTPKDWELVRVQSNIVSKVSRAKLKKYVEDYINTLPNKLDGFPRTALTEMIMKGVSSYFSNELLDFLPQVEVNTHMDTKTVCWFYYRNTAVKITREDNAPIPYEAISHKIWDEQILDRDCDLQGGFDNDFREFIQLIAGSDKYKDTDPEKLDKRVTAFETMLGYMMHGFKDRAEAKSIILNDAFNPTDDPRGGTGKGIVLHALRRVKNTVIQDGKIWDPLKGFAYQEVQPSTQILAIDDVKKGFKYSLLFSLVTEGVSVEKKGIEAYKIPFELSPKVIILTNHPLEGDGSSHERRRHELELDDFFIKTPPLVHFGRSLFDDWSVKEWQSFDRYMVFCVRQFLRLGLTELGTDNLKLRRLKELTHPVFVEWFTPFIEPKRYALMHLHNLLSNYNNDFVKYSQVKITKWIKKFADFYNIDYKTGRIGHEGRSVQSIEFTNLGDLKLVVVGNSDAKLVKDGKEELKTEAEILDNQELPF